MASRSRPLGRLYAFAAGTGELVLDGHRRRAGVARVRRWLDVPRAAARRVVHRSLVVEAQEEADTAYLLRHSCELTAWLPPRSALPPLPARVVFATVHTGAHVFAYAYLRKTCGLDVRAIARPLGSANPMAAAKRSYAEKKVAWLRRELGVDFLGTDVESLAHARDHLLANRPLFAAFDVPGNLASRTAEVCLCGERLRVCAGVALIARLTESAIVPLMAIRDDRGIRLFFGDVVPPGVSDPLADVFQQLQGFLRRWPDHWSLWGYVDSVG